MLPISKNNYNTRFPEMYTEFTSRFNVTMTFNSNIKLKINENKIETATISIPFVITHYSKLAEIFAVALILPSIATEDSIEKLLNREFKTQVSSSNCPPWSYASTSFELRKEILDSIIYLKDIVQDLQAFFKLDDEEMLIFNHILLLLMD